MEGLGIEGHGWEVFPVVPFENRGLCSSTYRPGQCAVRAGQGRADAGRATDGSTALLPGRANKARGWCVLWVFFPFLPGRGFRGRRDGATRRQFAAGRVEGEVIPKKTKGEIKTTQTLQIPCSRGRRRWGREGRTRMSSGIPSIPMCVSCVFQPRALPNLTPPSLLLPLPPTSTLDHARQLHPRPPRGHWRGSAFAVAPLASLGRGQGSRRWEWACKPDTPRPLRVAVRSYRMGLAQTP